MNLLLPEPGRPTVSGPMWSATPSANWHHPSQADTPTPLVPGNWPALRDAVPGDLPALDVFMRSLSAASRAARFYAPVRELPRVLVNALAQGSAAHHFIVVENGQEIIALGQYALDGDAPSCELALVVADAWQSRGLGRRMVEHLLKVAGTRGLRQATVETSASNTAMRILAQRSGFTLARHPDDARLVRGERSV